MVKIKHRYLLVDSIDLKYNEGLEQELLKHIGSIDYHAVNPKILQINGKLVIKCNLKGTSKLINALTMIKSINGKSTAFYTIKESGTIKALFHTKNKKQIKE